MGYINPMLHHNESEWSAAGPELYEYHSRTKAVALWSGVAVLAVALGVLVFYGYRVVKTQDARITQVFASQGTLATLGQRADAAESKLRDLAGDWQGLGQRVTKLEGRVATDAKQTRAYAQMLTQQLHEQITAEMDARTSPLDARLRQVESEEANQRAQMAQLETNLKQEISSVREDTGRDLSGVRQNEETNARDVSALSQKLDRQQIDFEMAKGQTKQLAPGISLRIRGVNAARERYHGTLSLLQDHRTIWLRDQSANQPVRFVPSHGGEAYELVVTDITKKAVAGYLLAPVVPAKSDSAAAAATNLTGQRVSGAGSVRE